MAQMQALEMCQQVNFTRYGVNMVIVRENLLFASDTIPPIF